MQQAGLQNFRQITSFANYDVFTSIWQLQHAMRSISYNNRNIFVAMNYFIVKMHFCDYRPCECYIVVNIVCVMNKYLCT